MNGTVAIVVRASLYFLISVLTPISAAFGEAAMYGYWPAMVTIVAAALAGLVGGLVAVRAYLDGSAERFAGKDRDAGNSKQD